MFNLADKIKIANQFIRALSWSKILQVLALMIILFSTWAAFENRQSIYNYVSQKKLSSSVPKLKELSSWSRKEIDRYVYGSDIVIGIQVHLVDFQKNSRSIIYTSTDVPELKAAWQQFSEDSLSLLPLFNSDIENNKRIVDLINGEIICAPYTGMSTSKLVPITSKHIVLVCVSGIPPSYGRFSGIINIHLKSVPSQVELDHIRAMARSLSSSVFEKDFK